jgi:hypothetical protein
MVLPVESMARVVILTALAYFDVRLINAIRSAREFQMLPDPLIDLGGILLNPAEDSSMVHSQPTLSHHLFQVPIAEMVSAIPSDAQENDRRLVVTPFERGFILFQDDASRRGDE